MKHQHHFTNKNLAFKHYLNYLNSKNTSDIDIANKYSELGNQNMMEYKETLLSILKEHNYKHQVFENGNIRYWYEEDLL